MSEKREGEKMTAAQMEAWCDRAIRQTRKRGEGLYATQEFERLRRREPAIRPQSDDDWEEPVVYDTRTVALHELSQSEKRLRAAGELTYRDCLLLDSYRWHGSYSQVARMFGIHRETVFRHLARIEKLIVNEAGEYGGWYWCWLESVTPGKRYFGDCGITRD